MIFFVFIKTSSPYVYRPEVNTRYVITQKHKPPPVPPKASGPVTPAPTPWLGKGPIPPGLYRDLTQSSFARPPSIPTMSQLEDGTMRMRVTRPMEKELLLSSSPGVAWQASKSQVFATPSTAVELNTPKILELDVNRMMIGQTDVRYCHFMFISQLVFTSDPIDASTQPLLFLLCLELGV